MEFGQAVIDQADWGREKIAMVESFTMGCNPLGSGLAQRVTSHRKLFNRTHKSPEPGT